MRKRGRDSSDSHRLEADRSGKPSSTPAIPYPHQRSVDSRPVLMLPLRERKRCSSGLIHDSSGRDESGLRGFCMWASDEPQFFLSYEISQDRFLPVLKPHDPLILCFHTRRGGGTDANHLGLSFRG